MANTEHTFSGHTESATISLFAGDNLNYAIVFSRSPQEVIRGIHTRRGKWYLEWIWRIGE